MTQEKIMREHKVATEINERYGRMTSCSKCRGKGYIQLVDKKGYQSYIDCECKPIVEKK